MNPEEIKIGHSVDLRVGLSTKEIERISHDEFAVHTTIDGWQTEYMNLQTLKTYINDKA